MAHCSLIIPPRLPMSLPKLTATRFQDSFTADAVGQTPTGWTLLSGTFPVISAGGLWFPVNGIANYIVAPTIGNDLEVQAQIGTLMSTSVAVVFMVNGAGNGYVSLIYGSNNLFRTYTTPGFALIINLNLPTNIGVPAIVRLRRTGARLEAHVIYGGNDISGVTTDTSYTGPYQGGVGSSPTWGIMYNWFRAVKL